MSTPAHKSATSVTLAPLAEKSPFEQFLQRYWMYGAFFLALAIAIILFVHQKGVQERQARDESWSKVTARAPVQGFPALPVAEPATFAALATEMKDTEAGPWVRALEADALTTKRTYGEAKAALEALRKDYPNHPLVAQSWPFAPNAPPASFVDTWEQALAQRQAWEEQHADLFANPPAEADAPRVKVVTSAGEFVLRMYPQRAPKHVESFLALVESKGLVGTKFHHIDPAMGIDGGDPNTIDQPVETWGQGGKDRTLEREDTHLYHFEGAVSAGATDDRAKTSAVQFTILTADHHELDGQRVVFAMVDSGLEVVKQIAGGEQDKDVPNRPAQPVSITAVERL